MPPMPSPLLPTESVRRPPPGIVPRALLVGLVVAVAVLLAPSQASAQDGPKALDCSFRTGTTAAYAKGAFQRRRAKPLAFAIEAIDLDGQAARLAFAGAKQAGALRLVRAIGANTYIEVASEGFMNVNTVYDRDPATGLHPAVHSRHLGIVGQPVVAQYTGACKAR